MDKKAKIKRIAELTCSEKWQENEDVVAEVQRIGKTIWTNEAKRRPPKKIAIWRDGKILVTGTAEELSEITRLSKNMIWDRARRGNVDIEGRQFKYMEGK